MINVDVLNLEWDAALSRDRIMATLVCNYLRSYSLNVVEGSIFNGFSLIVKLKPKLVLLTNSTGAKENFEISKYAASLGIKVVTLTSEGNFIDSEDLIRGFVWGWNKENIMYEDLNLMWSERAKDIAIKHFPEIKTRLGVSGAVGFDIYKLNLNKSKPDFLKRYGKESFTEVVGIGCWDFSALFPEDPRYETVLKIYDEHTLGKLRSDRDSFRDNLEELISSQKNRLFLIKMHPGCDGNEWASGVDGLEAFENVLILKAQESIFDCIGISDVWMVFESTTALEAWLMGKQTCLHNPSGTNFTRANIYKGSPNFSTVFELSEAINSFYANGALPGFAELNYLRDEIIAQTIQWGDGLNHVRAGNRIFAVLGSHSSRNRRFKFSLTSKIEIFKEVFGQYVPIRWFNLKTKLLRERFSASTIRQTQQRLKVAQQNFYAESNLSVDKLRSL